MIVEVNGKEVKLPDFFIVGAGKSGTTSLARYLSEHPEIYIPDIKEPQFFAFYGVEYRNDKPKPFTYIKKIEDYIFLFQNAQEYQILGEASTWYSISCCVDRTIENIKKFYGEKANNLKFIFIIRNPIERIFSAYVMYVDIGLEDLPFEKAISVAKKRIEEGYRLELNYIENMFISSSVQKYLDTFGKNKVKIYLYEDLKERPHWLLRDIFEFLGVDPNFLPSNIGKVYNKSGIHKSSFHKIVHSVAIKYNPLKPIFKKVLPEKIKAEISEKIKDIFYKKPELSPETRKKLKEIFREDILKLQELIGRDLSHWLKD